MGWLRNIVKRLARRAAKYAGIPLRDPALVAMFGSQPAASGVDVDETTALTLSTVWQAVTLIADNVAALPAIPYERVANGHREATGTPAWRLLLVEPNDEMTPFLFHQTLQAHATVWGNAYARLDKDSPEEPTTAAWPIPPNQVTPMRRETGELYYQFTAMYVGEVDEEIEPWEMLHVPGLGFDGTKGYSVVQQAREAIGLGLAEEKFGAAFFGRGCTLGGILEAAEEIEMTEKAKKNLRESFELLHRGPDNAHRIAILEDGLTYKSVGVPPEDAQFLASRAFQVAEIARWFNIPPHLLRDLSNATFSNIEHQGIDFLVYTLRPWLLRWQQEYARKLWPLRDRERYFVQHDPHNLLLTDVNARYDAYGKGRNGGWLTLNDILRREGQNPLPPELGDTRLAPSTMRTLGEDLAPAVDPAALAAAIEMVKGMKPVPEGLATDILRAVVPSASESLLCGLIAKLRMDHIVTGD